METLRYGLSLTAIPFACIFLLITIWWALVDLSVVKVKGLKWALWTLLVILLPPIGTLLYVLFGSISKEQEQTAAN